MARRLAVPALLLACAALSAPAAAQTLGTFRWQLQPHCNIVSVTVVQQGGQYQLDGTEDRCGGSERSSVRGLAFLNPDGSIGFGLTIVQPTGHHVAVAANISLTTLGGVWRADGGGLFGHFVFTPGTGTGGTPLPLLPQTAITSIQAGTGLTGGGNSGLVSLAVNYAATQQRVTGVCPSGQLMTGVQQNGQVTCQSVTGANGGDITAVNAGAGLTGGAVTGDVNLAVNFAGSGTAGAVARADHTHEPNNTRNIAIGTTALPVNAGIDNLAIGANAMQANTTGGGNIAIGSFSLRFGTTTTSNIAIGQAALESTTGSRNTVVGYLAGRANTVGADNVALGYRALAANTTASVNTAVGSHALGANTVGTHNTALGAEALQANLDGHNNTALGSFALMSNMAGSSNTAAGEQALNLNTSGSWNTAFGRASLASNTTGADNVAVGALALQNNTSASFNAALGREALFENTTGDSNTAVGHGALVSNIIGASNTAVGRGALPDIIDGQSNVAVGANAGAGGTGSNNIYLGADVAGVGAQSNTIRIGNSSAAATFIRGIHNATSSGGIGVFVNANGQLGTATSSARFKEQIVALEDSQHTRVQALRPVSFVYKPEFDDGSKQVQYGLIAEEVAETFPELLVRDAEGRAQTVRYHLLTPLLLAEVQRLERERDALENRVRALETALATFLDRDRQR